MSLTSCLKKAGKAVDAKDRAAIMAAAADYRREGMSASKAAQQAIRDRIAALDAEMAAPAANEAQMSQRDQSRVKTKTPTISRLLKNLTPNEQRKITDKVEDMVFADQKTGLMPEWTWTEGRVEDEQDDARRSERRATDRTVQVDGQRRPDSNSNGKPLTPPSQGMQALLNFWRWHAPGPTAVQARLSQAEVDGLKRDVQQLADFLESDAVRSHVGRQLQVPVPVIRAMVGVASVDDEVARGIVRALPVSVVNLLRRQKVAPEQALHDEAVLKNVLAAEGQSDVALGVDAPSDALLAVRVVAGAGAEVSGLTGGAFKANAAALASHLDSVLGSHSRILAGVGDSKVVDDQGRPLVVYHGTASDISEFKVSGRNIRNGKQTPGIYASPLPATASAYARTAANDKNAATEIEDANVMPLYMRITNPAEFTDPSEFAKADRAKLEAAGHDGAFRRNQQGEVVEVVAFSPDQIKSATGNDGSFDPEDADIRYSKAFHGTPHTVDKFSTSRIGTGEGAQAYGWGLYFAENEAVADNYRKTLAPRAGASVTVDGRVMDIDRIIDMARSNPAASNALLAVNEVGAFDGETIDSVIENLRNADDTAAADWLQANRRRVAFTSPKGSLYQVDIPDDVTAKMLLWDKPLSQQPDVLAAIKRGNNRYGETGLFVGASPTDTGEDFYRALQQTAGGQEAASKWLDAAGIPGVKYLDGVSRQRALKDVKREFLAELPEDADFDEVVDLLGTGTFSPKNEAVIKALQDSDWLGFDYPAQALSAALSPRLTSEFDAPADLLAAVEAAQDGSTYNYVVFNDKNVTITHKDGSPVTAEEREEVMFSKRPKSRTGGTNHPNAVTTATQSWTVQEPSSWDAVVRTMQDNKIDLKRVRDAVEEHLGRQLSDDQDAYMGEGLYHGKVAERIKRLHRERVEPILAKIAVAGKNGGVTIDDVNEYLHARHAPEANAQMRAINPGMPNNSALSGMSNAEAAAVISRMRLAGKEAALQAIAKDVWSLLADVRTDYVADGLEEAPTVWMWEQAYKHYVPLYRDMGADVQSGSPKGQGFAVKGPEAKRRVGSDRAVVDILANVVGQAETAAIRAEKAEVGRTLLAMVENNPNPDFWKIDTPKTKRVIDPATGMVTTQTIGLNGNEPNVIPVKQYGQTRYVVLNERNERAMMLARAMKNLDVAQVAPILQWAGKGTRFMASLLTQRNPEFWLTNLSRDLQGVAIQLGSTEAAGVQAQVAKNLPAALAGMRDLVRNDGTGLWARRAQELKDLGGTTGFMESFATSTERMAALEKEVARMQQGKADPRRLFRGVLDFIDDYNDVIENGVRLAVFQAARDAGISDTRSAWIAKNITVNFNKKGNLSPAVNSLYMFANASVQGTARMMQAVVTSRQAQAIVGGIAMAGFVMDIVNRAMAGDDDETGKNRYDMISQHEKATNWIFMRGEGKYLKVPMPIGYNIFHNAGRLFADAFNRKDPRDAGEYGWSMATMVAGAFLPVGGATPLQALMPSLGDPAAQLYENKNFMGGPVYKSADQGFGKKDPRPAYTRYFDTTPDTWKQAAKALNDITGGDSVKPGVINIEPDILRHVYGALTGGPGRALDKSLDASQASARGEKIMPSRYPLAGRFAGEVGDREKNSAFLEEQKRVATATTQHDYFLKERRRDLADAIAKEVGDGDIQRGRRLMAEFKRTDKDVRQINAAIRKLRQDKIDDTAQAAEFQRLKDQRTRIRARGLQRVTAGSDTGE